MTIQETRIPTESKRLAISKYLESLTEAVKRAQTRLRVSGAELQYLFEPLFSFLNVNDAGANFLDRASGARLDCNECVGTGL